MPSTHTSLHYHVVFSTKNRERWFEEAFWSDLHRYIGGCLKTVNCTPLQIGGVEDHVHLLFGQPANVTLSDTVREIKSHSSKWIKEKLKRNAFAWQVGYGAFTVSPSSFSQVTNYIVNQKEHHRTKTFEEEYVQFLGKHGVKFDPKYLW